MFSKRRPLWPLILLVSGVVACSDRPPIPAKVEKHCVNDSGTAQYYLMLDLASGAGQIRYKFLGQDVLYKVHNLRVSESQIAGRAIFAEAATGEERGAPFDFHFDPAKDTVIDGSTVASCVNLQDSSLAELPRSDEIDEGATENLSPRSPRP